MVNIALFGRCAMPAQGAIGKVGAFLQETCAY